MKKILLLIVVVGLLGVKTNAQNENALYRKMKMVQEQDMRPASLFQRISIQKMNLSAKLDKYTLLELNASTIQTLLTTRPNFISCDIPFENNFISVQLKRVNITALGFTINSDKGHLQQSIPTSVHYCGIIKGLPESIVSISIFDNEVMGLISSHTLGNLTIGRLKGKTTHIIYSDFFSEHQNKDWCGTISKDITSPYSIHELTTSASLIGKCVNVYVEVGNDIVLSKGGTANTANYIRGLFAQSAALYAAESITIQLSGLFLWSTISPYNATSSEGRLRQFQATRKSFNGDIAHLIDLRPYGGIADGFNAFCGTTTEKMCYSGIDDTYNDVPTYSWSVYVFTHEMGHLFGSRHTHACVWNGDNTAIDGCGPAAGYPTEGGCSAPAEPATGGTIMSYCHLPGRPGISFSNGFGPQPGNVVRNKIAGATCLNSCGCTDNITITIPINATAKYEVSNYIVGTSSVTVGSGKSVLFDAGNYIHLQPGFKVNISGGGYFKSYIDGCGGSLVAIAPNTITPLPENKKTEEINSKDNLEVYPNPFTNKLIISYMAIENNDNINIEILSTTGTRVVLLQQAKQTAKGKYTIEWDAHTVPAGLYIVILTNSKGKKIQKVVKL